MAEPIPRHTRPLAEILLEIKDELIDFVETRIQLSRAEFKETADSLKSSVPLIMTAGVLLSTAYLLVMAGLVSLVSFAFLNSRFRWPLSFFVVGIVWALGGVLAAVLARNAFRSRGTFPKRTLEVLKADGLWLHDEVKHSHERAS